MRLLWLCAVLALAQICVMAHAHTEELTPAENRGGFKKIFKMLKKRPPPLPPPPPPPMPMPRQQVIISPVYIPIPYSPPAYAPPPYYPPPQYAPPRPYHPPPPYGGK